MSLSAHNNTQISLTLVFGPIPRSASCIQKPSGFSALSPSSIANLGKLHAPAALSFSLQMIHESNSKKAEAITDRLAVFSIFVISKELHARVPYTTGGHFYL